ncbi:MAG: DUF1080 domain-containing protein [Bacteroidales bacterium]
MQKLPSLLFASLLLIFAGINTYSRNFEIIFGKEADMSDIITSGSYEKSLPVKWINVNTLQDTWSKQEEVLICSGHPIGVIRSEKQYENFILHIEWKHIEPGGNSGVFIWSNASPPKNRQLPDGVEVQMLELDYFKENPRPNISKSDQEAYVHGHLFGVGGVETVPDNRMENSNRSNSLENRCSGRGTWNTYTVVCVDGVVKLSVNGKFVNGVSRASQKKGYICLESEGAEIHFRNIRITRLPPGVISPEQTAPVKNKNIN